MHPVVPVITAVTTSVTTTETQDCSVTHEALCHLTSCCPALPKLGSWGPWGTVPLWDPASQEKSAGGGGSRQLLLTLAPVRPLGPRRAAPERRVFAFVAQGGGAAWSLGTGFTPCLSGEPASSLLCLPSFQGVLRIHFIEAQDLQGKDTYLKGLVKGKSDPYGVIRVGNQIFQSKVIKENLSPKWNEVYEVREWVLLPSPPPRSCPTPAAGSWCAWFRVTSVLCLHFPFLKPLYLVSLPHTKF